MQSDAKSDAIDHGTYEILQGRLRSAAKSLAQTIEQLNDARKGVFGSIEPELLSTERISTEHSCIPQDIVAVGEHSLFGFNVKFGLKTERAPSDVLAVYQYHDRHFTPRPLDIIDDAAFVKDFTDVYRFYKEARFEKFISRGPLLYMQLRTGVSDTDIKTFKWAVEGDSLKYVNNRSDHEVRLPPQHEWEWLKPGKDDYIDGRHPHINIQDRLFVETVGGDLTIKIEDNTDSGEGIYREPVDDPDQRLHDAEVYYAIVGRLILLKMRPYQEQNFRHLVYCERSRAVLRVDGIGTAGRLLPDEQGLIFSTGTLLQTGEFKQFDGVPASARFEQRIDSLNGEDSMFVFYEREKGLYVLLRYNVISQTSDAPLLCHGFSIFPSGDLVCFRAQPEPQRHHALQIWKTPFSSEPPPPSPEGDSELYKIGNREIVKGLTECREILALLAKEDLRAELLIEISQAAGNLLDAFYWIRYPAAAGISKPLEAIRDVASAAIDEFEKVAAAKKSALERTTAAEEEVTQLHNNIARRRFNDVTAYTKALAELRGLRGRIIGLRDVRYAPAETLDQLDTRLKEEIDRLAHRCVEFLDQPDALNNVTKAIDEQRNRLPELETARAAGEAENKVVEISSGLELLVDTISNLPIEDATRRTRIVDSISVQFAAINRLRAELRGKHKELARHEGAAEFGAQLKLLDQALANAMDRCETPAQCSEQLSRLLLQIEELETRFSELDEFTVTLAEKREEISAAFESRRVALVEAQAKRANATASAADRLLDGLANRARTLDSADAIHGFFASDLTVSKLRELAERLTELGDAARADGVITRLRSARDEALRQLRDRQDLFVEGKNAVRLGGYAFSVNSQPLDLTLIVRNNTLHLHLTGTQFFEAVHAPELDDARDSWNWPLPSESENVYRAEYLAYELYQEAQQTGREEIERLAAMTTDDLQAFVAAQMAPRYDEGYLKGVHDHDAALLLQAICSLTLSLGPLRSEPAARVLGRLFWNHACPRRTREQLRSRVQGIRELIAVWPEAVEAEALKADLQEAMRRWWIAQDPLCHRHFLRATAPLGGPAEEESAASGSNGNARLTDAAARLLELAVRFLAEQLIERDALPVSQAALDLADHFRQELTRRDAEARFQRAIAAVGNAAEERFAVASQWITAFFGDFGSSGKNGKLTDAEAIAAQREAAVLVLPEDGVAEPVAGESTVELPKFLGEHPRLTQQGTVFQYHDFFHRLARFESDRLPRFHRFQEAKQKLLARYRKELRLEEFQPKVMSSFVRNKLIDSVYLPLVGANLAKQMGTVGEETRVDRQGLLLLISPPGYGKTTLMEYLANRLGLVFLKINGPAIGHSVTSLDPTSAPNLAAREELQKLALGFEMGDNLMLYLDDIQHCHPEFLQKFISLCDAQRKIEGVWRGEARTYDLRGRKVAVVMAGNPYTESGDKFQIPDMLSNRADVYNLGDVAGNQQHAFELSFIENAITSNGVLSPVTGRQADVLSLIKLAQGVAVSEVSFEGTYTPAEVNDMTTIMRKLLQVRDVVLKVNENYIRSAAQADEYRTEPSFQLQGSYRNMNRIAERVLVVMNDEELQELIWSSYRNDAQTLTTGAESNLLKLRELLGWLSESEAARWNEIRRTYQRNQKMHGIDSSDRMGQAISQLSLCAEGLADLRQTLFAGFERFTEAQRTLTIETTAKPAANDGDSSRDHLNTQLQAVSAGLASLSQTLAGSPQRSETPAPELSAIQALLEELKATRPPLRFKTSDADSAASELTIINKIPSSLLNVLREQFRLMEEWLRPMHEQTRQQNEEISQLTSTLNSCLTEYRRLVGRIEATRSENPRSESARSENIRGGDGQ